jgi:hypothetical protein
MNRKIFQAACNMADQRQHLMMSTTDRSGVPHITSVGGFEPRTSDRIALSDWHCPATLINLQYNNQISLVVWDIVSDLGYQFVGQVEAVKPAYHGSDPELIVRVHQVLAFNHRGHSDQEVDEEMRFQEAGDTEAITGPHHHPLDAQRRRAYLYMRRSLGV